VARILTPIMSALLYGVAPTDPVTFAGVAIVLGTVTVLATYLPARRASAIDPIAALRSDI
jgi:ABC-type antimicrobial peptide transport system permease subunit